MSWALGLDVPGQRGASSDLLQYVGTQKLKVKISDWPPVSLASHWICNLLVAINVLATSADGTEANRCIADLFLL